MGVLDGMVIVKGERVVLRVNLGHAVVTNGDCCVVVRKCMDRSCYRLGCCGAGRGMGVLEGDTCTKGKGSFGGFVIPLLWGRE